MESIAGRRSLIQFSILLLGGLLLAIGARFVTEYHPPAAHFLMVAAGLLSWIAIVRELNASSLMFPRQMQPVIRWANAITLEIIAFAVLLLQRLATIGRKNQTASPHGLHPILLVHGYLNAGFVWDFQKNHLSRAGFGPIYTIDLGHPFQSIRAYAKKVEEKARKIAEETGKSNLTLIGHSMGGLVSYYYAIKIAPPKSVRKVIAIASPLSGTKAAKIGVGKCAREMQIGSGVLTELKAALEGSSDTQFYNIATKTDLLIMPYHSSILKTEPQSQFVFDDIGHVSLLFSQRVFHRLCQWLSN